MKIEEIVTRFEEDISWLKQGCNTELEIVEHIKEAIEKLKELKWWREHNRYCTSCKHAKKGYSDNPCSTCENWKDWECGYEEATKRVDVPDINVGK